MQIFEAIRAVVEAGTYEQQLIYFSGHSILLAPGTDILAAVRRTAESQ
jgi:hypothetical protein